MRDELIALCRPIFQPGTLRADVSFVIPGARIDLSANPIELIFDEPNLTVRTATEAELSTILSGLQASPPHPATLTAAEALARLTVPEQVAIFAADPPLAYRLFVATEPFAWETFANSIQELATAGVPIDAARILAP